MHPSLNHADGVPREEKEEKLEEEPRLPKAAEDWIGKGCREEGEQQQWFGGTSSLATMESTRTPDTAC